MKKFGFCLACSKLKRINDIGLCNKCLIAIEHEIEENENRINKGCKCNIFEPDASWEYCEICGKKLLKFTNTYKN